MTSSLKWQDSHISLMNGKPNGLVKVCTCQQFTNCQMPNAGFLNEEKATAEAQCIGVAMIFRSASTILRVICQEGLPSRPEELMLLCEFIMNSTRSPPSEEALYHTLLQLYLAGSIENQEEGLKKSHSPPRPARRSAFHLQPHCQQFELKTCVPDHHCGSGRD